MNELEPEERLFDRLEEATDGVASNHGGDPVAPIDSIAGVGEGQNDADLQKTEIVWLIRERLEQHPHFRGRTSLLEIELVDGTIVLSGCLPSHYLKQLLQEAIRLIPDVVDIDNRVAVMRPDD
jgi:hypothetical protein